MSWLSTVQDWFANAAKGNGLVIAVVLAAISAAIGLAVAVNWQPEAVPRAAIVLEPRSTGWSGRASAASFQGGATDPNAGLLFVLLACAMYALVPYEQPAAAAAREGPPTREVAVAG